MAKKEFTFRGKSLEELQKLSLEEFAHYVGARKRRTILRGLTEQHKKLLNAVNQNKNNIRTHCRDMIVLPSMVNRTIHVHSGKDFQPIIIAPEMIGHCLGELVFTRKRVTHSNPGIGATKSSSHVSVK